MSVHVHRESHTWWTCSQMDKRRQVNNGLPIQTRETASKMVVGFIRACLSFRPSPRFVPRSAQLSASQNSSCLQKRLCDIRIAAHPQSAQPIQHIHSQCVCLCTLEMPIASQAINRGWYHQMLLTSPVILQIHLLNWNNIGPKQDKGFISFYWCPICHTCHT